MRIGERDVMLPQSSELQMYHLDGSESLDIFDFTHCRSYHAESTIAFGGGPESRKPADNGGCGAVR